MPPSSQFASALHLMVVLAHDGDAFHTSNEIAESTSSNPVVLRRIAASLQTGGLVESQKGPGGGVRLAKPIEEITLDQIYSAVETSEPLHLPHTAPNAHCPVGRAMESVFKTLFTRAEAALQAELQAVTLAQVVEMVRNYQP